MARKRRRGLKGRVVVERVPLEDTPVAPSRQNRIFFTILVLGVLALSFLVFEPFLVSVLTGFLLAYLSYPIYRFFRAVLRFRSVAALVSLLFIILIVIVPFAALTVALVDDATDFAGELRTADPPPFVIDALDFYAKTNVEDPDNATQVQAEKERFLGDLLQQGADFLVGIVPELITLIGDFLLGAFIVFFIMYYAFVDGAGIVRGLKYTLPLPPHQTRFLLHETGNAIDAIFVGQLFSALLQGFLGGVGFWLFGIPNYIFWGAIMSILSLFPVIGAFLVWGPAGAWLIATGDATDGVLLLVWGAVLVSNVDNIAKPILIGDRADIHPIAVLIGVLGGLVVFGPIGFVLGPLILGVLTAVLKVWNEEYHDATGWVYPTRTPVPEEKEPPERPPPT
ncbi:MAG: AI-2E family transporter [Euryarchaeota archaeon]|nr:AI-2E family transporter [Euryarchaeota archaeon]